VTTKHSLLQAGRALLDPRRDLMEHSDMKISFIRRSSGRQPVKYPMNMVIIPFHPSPAGGRPENDEDRLPPLSLMKPFSTFSASMPI
jgi:hypothetical protein